MRFAVVCLVFVSAALAQLDLSLALVEPHPYHEGELIRAQVRFNRASLSPLEGPQRETWHFAGFLLDPAGPCGTLAAPCFAWGTLGADKTDPTLRFGDSSAPLQLSLNRYLPPLRSGRYRAALLAGQQVLLSRAPMSATYGYAKPPRYILSNTVDIEVVPAAETWIRATIAKADPEELRFLDVPAAWRASLALLPASENVLLRGLAATREPAQVCEVMRAAVPAPSQAVSSFYLEAMALTCARASHESRQDVIAKATSSLAASIARKQGVAKTVAFDTLIDYVRQFRIDQPRQPLPAWIQGVTGEFINSYHQLEGGRQAWLLGRYGSTLRWPALVPLLESVMDAWEPGNYYEAPREALVILYAIDPARAQARILAELTRPKTWLDVPQLELLPAGAARITDDALIEALAEDGWLRMAALGKYASAKALPRIQAIYESQKDPCQPELMAYFVRLDPAYAARVLQAAAYPCTVRYFERTPTLAMAPVLERYIAPYLMQGNVPEKMAAAKSLGRYGSPAALGPLWDTFRYFHEYWKGKQAALAQNQGGEFLETELRSAIARGRHWLATEADLRTIESLCISERCQYETQNDLQAWQKPLRIEIDDLPGGGWWAGVAQYRNLGSIEALEEKLGQFPKGTEFLLYPGDPSIAARIRKHAAARGLVILTR